MIEMLDKILTTVHVNPQEIMMSRSLRRAFPFIRVSSDGVVLILENAIENAPSVKLNHPRRIRRNEFLRVAPYYREWSTSAYAFDYKIITDFNAHYIFQLISAFNNDSIKPKSQSGDNWYAMFVRSGMEYKVAEYLENNLENVDYDTLIPLRRLYRRIQGVKFTETKKMFPDYVLVRCEDLQVVQKCARNCDYFIKTLGDDSDYLPMRTEEMAFILSLVDENGIIEISDIYFAEDGRATCTRGPLFGYDAIIKRVFPAQDRLKIGFVINGVERELGVAVNYLNSRVKPSDYAEFKVVERKQKIAAANEKFKQKLPLQRACPRLKLACR